MKKLTLLLAAVGLVSVVMVLFRLATPVHGAGVAGGLPVVFLQSGSTNATATATITNTFPVAFLSTPNFVFTSGQTNAAVTALTSTGFTLTWSTNAGTAIVSWMAIGQAQTTGVPVIH